MTEKLSSHEILTSAQLKELQQFFCDIIVATNPDLQLLAAAGITKPLSVTVNVLSSKVIEYASGLKFDSRGLDALGFLQLVVDQVEQQIPINYQTDLRRAETLRKDSGFAEENRQQDRMWVHAMRDYLSRKRVSSGIDFSQLPY